MKDDRPTRVEVKGGQEAVPWVARLLVFGCNVAWTGVPGGQLDGELRRVSATAGAVRLFPPDRGQLISAWSSAPDFVLDTERFSSSEGQGLLLFSDRDPNCVQGPHIALTRATAYTHTLPVQLDVDRATSDEISSILRFLSSIGFDNVAVSDGNGRSLSQQSLSNAPPFPHQGKGEVIDLVKLIAKGDQGCPGHFDDDNRCRLELNVAAALGEATTSGLPLSRSLAFMKERRARCELSKPFLCYSSYVPMTWADYNGHMNEAWYSHAFSLAGDEMMVLIGMDEAYISHGKSLFTIESNIKFKMETMSGDLIRINSTIIGVSKKIIRVIHKMINEYGYPIAIAEKIYVHVDLKTRKSVEFELTMKQKLDIIVKSHSERSMGEV